MGYVYKDMERLRFWCQKVLPTVYDDSLSYYELLCKVVQYLNDTVENVNTLIQQVADIDTDLSNVAIIQDSGMSTEYVWSSAYTNTKMNDKIHNSIINMRSAGSTGATYSCQYLTNNFAELENGKVKSSELPSDIVNTIEGIKVNGSTVNPDANKIVNLVVMTNAVDNLINYYTKTQTYSKSEVDTIASNIRNSRFEVVQSLPTTGIQTNVIYLVPKTSAGTQDGYNEYINLDGTTSGWELIGSTDIDLSGYVTTTDLNNALANYVTTLTLTGILNNYITVSELATELASYATVSSMNTALAGKQNTLTFDNFPTAGSTNPVTSGGVKSATTEIWGVLGAIEPASTSANAYEIGDHFFCRFGCVEVIAPIAVGDEIQRNVNVVETTMTDAVSDNLRGVIANTQLIADTVGWSGKNKLIPNLGHNENAGLIYDITKDSISISGTSTGSPASAYLSKKMPWSLDRFAITSNQQLSGDLRVAVYVYNGAGSAVATPSIYLNGTNYKKQIIDISSYTYDAIEVRAWVSNGKTISVSDWKLMIVDENTLDLSFEENRNTTAFPRDEQAMLGAKNVLENKMTTRTNHSVTVTPNADGSFLVNGTNDSSSTIYFEINSYTSQAEYEKHFIPNKNYILSGGYAVQANYQLLIEKDGAGVIREFGGGHEFTAPSFGTTAIKIYFAVGGSKTVTNETIKPMIRLASDPDDTFVPYAMTNRELTLKVTPEEEVFNVTGGKIYLKKINDVVYVAMDTISSLSADTWENVGDSNFYVPNKTYFGDLVALDGGVIKVRIQSNGKVDIRTTQAITQSKYIQSSSAMLPM